MNIEEYIELYFSKYTDKKYMIIQGNLVGGPLKWYEPIQKATKLNDYEKTPVLKSILNAPKSFFIISKYDGNQNNFYNFQILEGNSQLQLGFGLSIDENFKFYLTESQNLIGNIKLSGDKFKLNRYNAMNNIFDYAECDIISYKVFENETGIKLE